MSSVLVRTRRDDPADVEAASHRLLIRAGFIRPLAAGIYSFLPLGVRCLAKIEQIIREEMQNAGAQEILMPALLPSEPWKKTGRWDTYGAVLLHVKDRQGREFCLGPTHEEIVTPLIAAEYSSYKDLPVTVYQIQAKFRDELRPRHGLIRGREFIMKDAYSFDRDTQGLKAVYEKMIVSYSAIFRRLGLKTLMVEALAGEIGGDVNHEFLVPADVGEDMFVSCSSCDYSSNLEAASAGDLPADEGPAGPLEKVHTPATTAAEGVAELLNLPVGRILKCIMYKSDSGAVAALVPGEREVNESKLRQALASDALDPFTDADFAGHGVVKGYVGPLELQGVQIIADQTLRGRTNLVAGANESDHHWRGVLPGRDFEPSVWADIATVIDGDRCPRAACSGRLKMGRAIEVGHVFQLGTRYTAALGAFFADERGHKIPMVMGCYGIGVSRLLACIAQQHHDASGLIWPASVAPYQVCVIPTNPKKPSIATLAERVYKELRAAGIEVIIDDRVDVSAGERFKDADLIGYPLQVIAGKAAEAEIVEVKDRRTSARQEIAASEVINEVGRRLA